MPADAPLGNRGLHRQDCKLQRRRHQPRGQHAAAVMVMRDRPVIMSLRKSVMGVMACRGAIVVRMLMAVPRRGIMILRVGVSIDRHGIVMVIRMHLIRRSIGIMFVMAVRHRHMVIVLVSQIGDMLDVDFQVVGVIEHGAREAVGRMIDLERMLKAFQHGNRHLRGQRHAQRHAEQGHMPLRDDKPLADHAGTIRERTRPGQVRQRPQAPHQGYRLPARPTG